MNLQHDPIQNLADYRISGYALLEVFCDFSCTFQEFKMSEDVIVIIGAGGIGIAIARRQGFGKTVLLADINAQTLEDAATVLNDASYNVHRQIVDVTSRESVKSLADKAASLGRVLQVLNTAGLSPNMAPPAKVLAVDLFGVALVLEEFERVIAHGGSAIVISSMAGHMPAPLPPEHEHALAFAPSDELLALPFLAADAVPDSMVAYGIAKKANHLRVQAASLSWGERGARVNSISPGIIATPLAQHEMASESGPIYRAMIAASPAKRMASPDEVAAAAAFLFSPEAGFITGSDLLMDGGVIPAMRAGRLENPI
jgi:NAD(P)-dependent dehydrogenase (short-subunit alcohol dehydrogenase family)